MPYKVLTGLSYPPDKRAEVGDIITDLPSQSVQWLINNGHIEDTSGTRPEPTPASAHSLKPEIIEKDGE